jgi:TPR repeat protein
MEDHDFQKGIEAFDRGDYETAYREWRPLADQGDPRSQFSVGLLFLQGQGVPKDTAEAAKWFRMCAEQGDAAHQYLLGSMYATGLYGMDEGIPRDDAEAAIWLKKAADQGYEKAATWCSTVAREGHTEAQYQQGLAEYGEDSYRACQWAKAAADQGHMKACMLLCEIFHDIYFDYEEAAKWYRRGRQLGHPHDPEALWFGKIFETDAQLGHVADRAENGSLYDQRLLGLHYASITPPDFQMAYAWLSGGLSHAFGDTVPPYEYGEDKSIRAWRFLNLILDEDELQRAQSLAAKIRTNHPPKPPRDISKSASNLLGIFGKDKPFDAALNAAMAVYTYQILSAEDRERIEAQAAQTAFDAFPKKNPILDQLNLDTEGVSLSPSYSFPDLREDLQHGVYVVLMRKLGIKPAIPGERWRRLENSPLIYVSLDMDAKKDAETYLLEKHGIDVSRHKASTGSVETADSDL